MTDEEKELAGWRAEWQTLGDVSALTAELSARCARDGRRLRRSLARELVAAAFSSVVAAGLIVRTRGLLPVVVICSAILVFNGVWATRFLLAQNAVLGEEGEGLDAFVSLTRRRLASERSLSRFAWNANVAISAFLGPAIAWLLVARWERYREHPWNGVVGVSIAVVIHVGVFLVLRRKRAHLDEEERRFEELVTRGTLPQD